MATLDLCHSALTIGWAARGLRITEQVHLVQLSMMLWNTNRWHPRIMVPRTIHWLWLEDGGRKEVVIGGFWDRIVNKSLDNFVLRYTIMKWWDGVGWARYVVGPCQGGP